MTAIERARIELSAGGVVFRRARGGAFEALLIQDSYGNWGFPKGHVEPGETAAEAALRECREETGLGRLRLVGPLGTTDWYFRAGPTLVHKFCDYFLIEADADEAPHPQSGEGIRAVLWLPEGDALARITYANARRVLELALERLAAGVPGTPHAGGRAGDRAAAPRSRGR
jgi:8-oxo-dGTP pyrophosphatase MutT (NUDIX family)